MKNIQKSLKRRKKQNKKLLLQKRRETKSGGCRNGTPSFGRKCHILWKLRGYSCDPDTLLEGCCYGIRTLKTWITDPNEGEAKAILEAVKWTKEMNLSSVLIESDSKSSISFLLDECKLLNWKSSLLLKEAKSLAIGLLGVNFCYCPRLSNRAAVVVAKLGRASSALSKTWCNDFPESVSKCLSEDEKSLTCILTSSAGVS